MKQEPIMKVAAYIRVSTDMEDQENSFETQERYFHSLISRNKNWIFAGVYSDYGISGTSADKRVGFLRMVRHCKERRIDRILCKSVSRFSRNTTDFLETMRVLKECQVTIFFEKEGLDTAEPVSEFVLTALAAIAQEESRSISANILLGNKMRFSRGEIQNKEIYGYRFSDQMVFLESGYQYHDLEIVEEEAEVVRRIFREASDGKTATEIAAGLNREGIPAPVSRTEEKRKEHAKKGQMKSEMEQKWNKNTISRMLKMERYMGDVMVGKRYVKDHLTHKSVQNKGEREQYLIRNHHPAIISRELYHDVNVFRLENEKHRTIRDSELKGLLICGNCGRYLVRQNVNHNPKWRCPTAREDAGICRCSLESIYEEQIIRVLRKGIAGRFLSCFRFTSQYMMLDLKMGQEQQHIFDRQWLGAALARLHNLQQYDQYEMERACYKKKIHAAQIRSQFYQTRMKTAIVKRDVAEVRREALGEDTLDGNWEMIHRDIESARREWLEVQLELETLTDELRQKEEYWKDLEKTHVYREKAIEWMKEVLSHTHISRDFFDGLTSMHFRAFVMEMVVHDPLHYTLKWVDGYVSEVEMNSNVEDYRRTRAKKNEKNGTEWGWELCQKI